MEMEGGGCNKSGLALHRLWVRLKGYIRSSLDRACC